MIQSKVLSWKEKDAELMFLRIKGNSFFFSSMKATFFSLLILGQKLSTKSFFLFLFLHFVNVTLLDDEYTSEILCISFSSILSEFTLKLSILALSRLVEQGYVMFHYVSFDHFFLFCYLTIVMLSLPFTP